MFPERKLSMLEWFMKDYVTLKTGVMNLKIQLCITWVNYFYILFLSFCYNISQYNCFYCISDQINAAYKTSFKNNLQFYSSQTSEQ